MKKFLENEMAMSDLDKVAGGNKYETNELYCCVIYPNTKPDSFAQELWEDFTYSLNSDKRHARMAKWLKEKCSINAYITNDKNINNIYMRGKTQLTHKQTMYLARVATGLDV